MSRLLVLLLLLTVSVPLLAREVKLAGANGDGACPDASAHEPVVVAREKARVSPVPAKAKAAPYRGGGEAGNTLRTPRWHSFVPGMFR